MPTVQLYRRSEDSVIQSNTTIGTMSTNTAGQAKRQKTDNDSSTAAEDDRNHASPPTEEDISLALCRIVDTDKYTPDEIKKALENIYTWRFTSNDNQDECVRISKEFMELGGVPRILNFIKVNKDNVGSVLRASRVIGIFLHSGSNDEHLENAAAMAQKFVERKGVEMMLSIIKENYTGELDFDQLNSLALIFAVFPNIIWNMNRKNMVDIDNFSPIIDTGISTMAILNNISTHDEAVASIKKLIFTFFNIFVDYNAEMIDVDDFHEKNIFPKCVRSLKNPDNSWKYDKDVWKSASLLFYKCCLGNRKILSRDDDFEVIVPFLIQFMKEDPDYANRSNAFDILRKASDTIGKKKMLTSHKGLLAVLGAVADCGNDNVSNAVKEKAMTLMKYLFDVSS